MKNSIRLALMLVALSITQSAFADLITVPQVDLGRFAGTWYQIARNPIIFEPANCFCARQVLTPRADGKIDVYNSCNRDSLTGPLAEIRGTAEVSDPKIMSKLSVNFGSPIKGDYWIIALDKEYRYAVVTDRFKYSLYILSKTPTLDEVLYQQAVTDAQVQVKTNKLKMTPQLDCRYP